MSEKDGPLPSPHLAMVFEMVTEMLIARFSKIEPDAAVCFRFAFFASAPKNLNGRIVSRDGVQRLNMATLSCKQALANQESKECGCPTSKFRCQSQHIVAQNGRGLWEANGSGHRVLGLDSQDLGSPRSESAREYSPGTATGFAPRPFMKSLSHDAIAKLGKPKMGQCVHTLLGIFPRQGPLVSYVSCCCRNTCET